MFKIIFLFLVHTFLSFIVAWLNVIAEVKNYKENLTNMYFFCSFLVCNVHSPYYIFQHKEINYNDSFACLTIYFDTNYDRYIYKVLLFTNFCFCVLYFSSLLNEYSSIEFSIWNVMISNKSASDQLITLNIVERAHHNSRDRKHNIIKDIPIRKKI